MVLPAWSPLLHLLVTSVVSLVFGAQSVVAESAGALRTGKTVPFFHSKAKSPVYTKKPATRCLDCKSEEVESTPSALARGAYCYAYEKYCHVSPAWAAIPGYTAYCASYNSVCGKFPSKIAKRDLDSESDDSAEDVIGGLLYSVEISLGGQNYTVQLDTGSSDLWLYTAGRPIELTNSTDLTASAAYGDAQVPGNIQFAELKLGDFTIDSQAFLNATNVPVGFNLTSFDGVLGMAFDIGAVFDTVQGAWGAAAADTLALTPMSALFAENPTFPNNFDILLFRTPELDDMGEGVLFISSHGEGYESVASAPQLPRVQSEDERWSIVMDGMRVNGQAFSFNASRVGGVPSGSVVAMLDSGSSFPALPPAAVDAIYGSIPGAAYDDLSQGWFVPCNGSTNLTFVFGGQEFPVHPQDLAFPVVTTVSINGWSKNITTCINTYQYLFSDPTTSDGFDIVLGDGFLRNVYASFNYGDWNPTNNTNGTPFVQMLSTTNTTSMWDDFQRHRATTLFQLPPALDPTSIVQYNSDSGDVDSLMALLASSGGDDESTGGWLYSHGEVILGLLLAIFVVNIVLLGLLLLPLWVRFRRRGERPSSVQYSDYMEERGEGESVMQPLATHTT